MVYGYYKLSKICYAFGKLDEAKGYCITACNLSGQEVLIIKILI